MNKTIMHYIPGRGTWFLLLLDHNIKKILKNPQLTNQQKGHQIYYDVFWKTWHRCYEPNLYGYTMYMMNVQNKVISILNRLGFQYPQKHLKALHYFDQHADQNYHTSQVGAISVGCLAKDVDRIDLRENLWHFGYDPNLKNSMHQAFDAIHWYQ